MSFAEKFFEEFISKTKRASFDHYLKNKIWTKKTKEFIEEILSGLKKEIIINYEYYKIDIIGWSQHKDKLDVKETRLVPHLWNLEFAVEHENDSKEWLDEVCKLAYIRCPLRVVIGYGKEKADEKIEIVKTILRETNAFTDDEQEFLIIIGPQKKEIGKGESDWIKRIIKKSDIKDSIV